MKTRIQAFALILLTAVVLFFAIQNSYSEESLVPVVFLVWDFQASVSLLVLFPLLIGLLLGAATAVYVAARRRAAERARAKQQKASAETAAAALPAADPNASEAGAGDEEEVGTE